MFAEIQVETPEVYRTRTCARAFGSTYNPFQATSPTAESSVVALAQPTKGVEWFRVPLCKKHIFLWVFPGSLKNQTVNNCEPLHSRRS